MRSVILLLLYLLCTTLVARPIPITTLAYEWHDADYFAEQAGEWKQVVATESCAQSAWYDYYMAAHYANVFGYEPAFDLDEILVEAEAVLTEQDFALHYLRCRRAKDQQKRFEHLMRGNELEPEEAIAYPGLAMYHELKGNYELRDSFMTLIATRTPYPRGSMDWNYNQLQSVSESNAILLTYGDNDTYPSWVLQGKYGIKPTVEVVNLPMLLSFPAYRARIFAELSVVEPASSKPDQHAALLLDALAAGDRPVYVGSGMPKGLINDRADQMFLTGLAFRYTSESFNNLGALVKNYRTKWRLDELHDPLDTGPRQRVADQLNQNYLPALLELRGHFETNDPIQFSRVNGLIEEIAERSGLGNIIKAYLEPEVPQLASNDPGLKAKQIDKKVVNIPGGTLLRTSKKGREDVTVSEFYLQSEEVSNADYLLFLEDLLRQRKFDVLDSAAIQAVDYLSLMPDSLSNIPKELLYKEGKPTDDNHPVTNISHRAAQLYANWLTQVYNQDPKRKDGRIVRFRLPTRKEFIYAAAGGRNYTPYPWGGPYIRNLKGCYLANFNTLVAHTAGGSMSPDDALDYMRIAGRDTTNASPPQPSVLLGGTTCNDGGYLSVPTDAYFPNDYSLYQMSGNAAEMIDEPGKDMGGSWLDHAFYMRIGAVQERPLPHPTVGFRLVMDVLKE